MRKIWPFSLNVLIFAGFAFVAPFLVLYYQSVGLTGTQIGILSGVTPLVTLFCTPLWTNLADVSRRHRLIMSLCILMAAGAVFVFPLVTTFVPILLIAILFNAAFSPILSFTDSATMFMLADEKDKYGRIRVGGTLGFGLAASIAGVLIQNYGLKFAFWGCSALLLLSFFVSQNLVHSPVNVSGSARSGVRKLLRNPRWRLFLIVALAGGLASSSTNTYLFPYMKSLGANESTMGLALTIGTLSEIPILFFGNRLIQRFKPYGLLMLAMLITGGRLMLFAISDSPSFILFFQLLNGLTFPAMWIAGVAYADQNAPAGMAATAQGLFGAMVFGFGAAVGGFIGGPLLESIGGRGLYLVFGAAVLIVITVAALMQKHLSAEQKIMSDVALQ